MKKLMAGLLALTMVFGSFAIPAAESGVSLFDTAITAEAAVYGDFEYEVLSDGTIEITKYEGSSKSVSVPSKINGKKVTSIGHSAFVKVSSMKSITIPSGVTSLGNCAFQYCSNLTDITIPSSVKKIGFGTFNGTKWLENKRAENPFVIVNGILVDGMSCTGNITIPSSVTSITDNAFYQNLNLTGVTIPNSVTSIGERAFGLCTAMTSVKLPSSIKTIEAFTFNSCRNLTDVTIPYGVTSIEKYAFESCTSLKSVTLPNSLKSIGERSFSVCEVLEEIVLPDSLTEIGISAFSFCQSLESITVPDGIKAISDYTFYDCRKLKKVTIPASVTSIGAYAFYSCEKLSDVYFGGSKTDWNKITVGEENKALDSVTLHYSYVAEPIVSTVTVNGFSSTDTAIRINWKKATNASGCRIYRYNTSTKKWDTVATLSGADTLTYKQSGLKAGTTYKYKVKAYAKSNGKTYWGEASETMTTTTKPAKPTIKSYSSTTSAVRLNWNTVTGATGYRVYRYNASTKKWETVATIKNGSANTYRDSGRKAKTSYQYKIKAYRKVNNVNYWGDASAAKTCKTK